MASASVTWNAEYHQFMQQLRSLPADLTAEGGTIVLNAGEAAHSEIAAGYPEVTGNLKRGLRLTKSNAGTFGASVTLRNSSKIAWIYDHGSQARHYVTKSGAKHSTGKMWGRTAPTFLFVRTVVKRKRQMVELLKDVVRRAGMTVSGE